jgi:hypothetical protein
MQEAQCAAGEAVTNRLVIRDGIGYIETESATGCSLTSATPADYVAEIERLAREVAHLREACASWGVVPARLPDEPGARQVELFVVKHYASDERPTIKGNGFDGLEVGEDRESAQEFVDWINARLGVNRGERQ